MAKKYLNLNGKNVGSKAEWVDYDNTESGMESTTVQSAIDELASSIGGGGGSQSQTNPFQGKSMLVIGDSFTADDGWLAVMKAKLGLGRIVNQAVSGGSWTYRDATTADPNMPKLTASYRVKLAVESISSPDYILVMDGVNDCGNFMEIGNVSYSSVASQSNKTVDQIYDAVAAHYSIGQHKFAAGVQACIALMQLVFPDAVIFIGFTPNGQQYLRPLMTYANATWDTDGSRMISGVTYTFTAPSKYVDMLKKLALIHGVRYIDTFNCGINPWLVDHQNKYQNSYQDAHPQNAAAYQRMGEYMAMALLREV